MITAVAAESLAGRLGLRPGDELLEVNGHAVQDVIDVRFYASDPTIDLLVRRSGKAHQLRTERRYGEALGLEFADPIFDRLRRCDNHCEFCFVAQMPSGLRPSLYVRDDDYRASFLSGSYVTLTNLTAADWRRIDEQHLTPLYVSVHATELDLRRRFLGNPEAPDILAQLGRLRDMGITVHTQVVIRPGLNDGEHLDRSIEDLAQLYPAVRSVSIVPLGLTKYHRFQCRLQTDEEVREVLEQVTRWQARVRKRLGAIFAYLSDEWYLRIGEAVPKASHYDGLDLTENGVGLVRQFLDHRQDELVSRISDLQLPTIVTSTLFAPVLRSCLAGTEARVVPIVNRFFGESITVAGLLTAEDVVGQLSDRDGQGPVILPAAMFGGPEGQSLDEARPVDIESALGREVVVGPS